MNTHHVFSLSRDQLLLNLPPGDGLETGVRDLESGVVEAFDVPELEHVVDDHDHPGHPEQAADQDEHLGQEAHVTETNITGHVKQGDFLSVIILRQ